MAQTKGVDILEKIRKSKGYTPYQMAKLLGISQTSYKYLSGTAQTIRSDLLVRAAEIAAESPQSWDLNRFWEELSNEVKRTKFKRAKKT